MAKKFSKKERADLLLEQNRAKARLEALKKTLSILKERGWIKHGTIGKRGQVSLPMAIILACQECDVFVYSGEVGAHIIHALKNPEVNYFGFLDDLNCAKETNEEMILKLVEKSIRKLKRNLKTWDEVLGQLDRGTRIVETHSAKTIQCDKSSA